MQVKTLDSLAASGVLKDKRVLIRSDLNVPRNEVEQFTDQIKGGEFQMLFDSFETYDVQETRRVSKEEGKAEGKAENLAQAGGEGR